MGAPLEATGHATTQPVVEGSRPVASPARRLSICLINPKFEPSYWGFDYALPLYPGDKRCTMITGALPALAALAEGHDVALIDENIEAIDFEALRQYDVIGLTGMNVQKKRMREILTRLREMKLFVAVGGAYASVDPHFFNGLCDVLFDGEAETTWPEFLADYAAGRPWKTLYRQAERTDMTKVPMPRYDLLKVNRYASGALQFSRGCPFQCEFCDIIVTFGRRPRMKKPQQLVDELECMRKAGFFSAFIVDDNFIGNKKAAKELLRLIIPWQEKHGYPLKLSTEASVNLADDAELLELLYQANFRHVFIGLETPREASLKETKKFQNVRGDSLAAKLERVQRAGIDINAGFIVGFDNDDAAIFEDQFRFIQDNGVVLAMVGMLQAIPKTPLYDRMKKAGRLVESDDNCNIVPAQMSREELREGVLGARQAPLHARGVLRPLFCRLPIPRVPRAPRVDLAQGGRGQVSPDLPVWRDPFLDVVPGALARRLAAQSRRHLPPLLLPGELGLSQGRDRFRAVHEPLRDPLALLSIHARRIRGQAAVVQHH